MIQKILVAAIIGLALAYWVWRIVKMATTKEVDCGCGRGRNCKSKKK